MDILRLWLTRIVCEIQSLNVMQYYTFFQIHGTKVVNIAQLLNSQNKIIGDLWGVYRDSLYKIIQPIYHLLWYSCYSKKQDSTICCIITSKEGYDLISQ